MSDAAQATLTGVLQDRERSRPPFSPRIIVASNRILNLMMTEGKFRPDLYSRLGPLSLRTEALRERPEDIPVLLRHYLNVFNGHQYPDFLESNSPVDPAALHLLARFDWPGNFSQLQFAATQLLQYFWSYGVIDIAGAIELLDKLHRPGCPVGTRSAPISLPQHFINVRSFEVFEAYLDRVELELIVTALAASSTIDQCARCLRTSTTQLINRFEILRRAIEGRFPAHVAALATDMLATDSAPLRRTVVKVPEQAGQVWPRNQLTTYRDTLARATIKAAIATLPSPWAAAMRLDIPFREVQKYL